MSCVVKGLISSTKAEDFPVCMARCTTGPARHPKNKEQLVCMYLAKCKLVNALPHMNPVEEASGMWFSGLALGCIGHWSCTQGGEIQSVWKFFIAL